MCMSIAATTSSGTYHGEKCDASKLLLLLIIMLWIVDTAQAAVVGRHRQQLLAAEDMIDRTQDTRTYDVRVRVPGTWYNSTIYNRSTVDTVDLRSSTR